MSEQNEPKTLAERMDSDTDSTPSEATDADVRGRIGTVEAERKLQREMGQSARKERLWQAWRAAWNQRGSTDSMDSLEERTARTAFEQWWEKDA